MRISVMETLIASSGAPSSGQQPSTSTARSTTASTIPPLLLPPARGILAGQPQPDKHSKTFHAASSVSPPPRPANGSQFFESLPHLAPSSTKAGRYSKLVEFDKHVLKRPKAHCKNALRSTEELQIILGQLNKDLKKIHTDDELQVELEKLSVYSKAFEEVIPLTGPYASRLSRVKDMYDGRVKDALTRYREVSQPGGRRETKKHHSKGRRRAKEEEDERNIGEGATQWPGLRAPPLVEGAGHGEGEYGGPGGHQPVSHERELYQLKRELHQLEVKCRVLVEENRRLGVEFDEEEQKHKTAMESLLAPLPEPEEVCQPHSSEVERLQMEIAVTLEQLEAVRCRRKGRVPIQVCRQLEQTNREMENEQHKLRKQNELLKQQVEGAKLELQTILDQHHTSSSSAEALWTALGQKVT